MDAQGKSNSADIDASSRSGAGCSGHSQANLRDQNEAVQAIPLSSTRLAELPTELNQFFAATLANRRRLDFDAEPAGFTLALARHARETS